MHGRVLRCTACAEEAVPQGCGKAAAGKLHAPEGGTGTVLPAFENAALGRFVGSVTRSLMKSLPPHQL